MLKLCFSYYNNDDSVIDDDNNNYNRNDVSNDGGDVTGRATDGSCDVKKVVVDSGDVSTVSNVGGGDNL